MVTVQTTNKHGSAYIQVEISDELYQWVAQHQQQFLLDTGLAYDEDNYEMRVHDALHAVSGLGVSTDEERTLYFTVERELAQGRVVECIPTHICNELHMFYATRGE